LIYPIETRSFLGKDTHAYWENFLSEEEKSSKKTAGYINEPKANEKCSNCNMWRPPNACTAVKGKISPDGWCKWHQYNRKDRS
jgi:hypothetical protein